MCCAGRGSMCHAKSALRVNMHVLHGIRIYSLYKQTLAVRYVVNLNEILVNVLNEEDQYISKFKCFYFNFCIVLVTFDKKSYGILESFHIRLSVLISHPTMWRESLVLICRLSTNYRVVHSAAVDFNRLICKWRIRV